MLPGLSSSHCIFDGGVHTDVVASIDRKDIYPKKRKTERAKA